MKAENQSSANKSIQGELPQTLITQHAKDEPKLVFNQDYKKFSITQDLVKTCECERL